MTDNEIIKSFACHTKDLLCHTKEFCKDCILCGKGCTEALFPKVLDLITRPKRENENYQTVFLESYSDMLSEYSNVLIGKLLFAKENTINNPNKEDSLEYIRGKAEAFETAVKLIDKALEEMAG